MEDCFDEPYLLLVSGIANSGKTTLADYLCNTYPKRFKQYALGDKVKELVFKILKVFNVPINSIDDLYNRDTKEKYRRYLQEIATECCRDTFGDDFWSEILLKQITIDLQNGYNVIISDVRFENEQQYFTSHINNVKTVMIRRKGIINSSKHISEQLTGIKFDFVIKNSGTLEEYYEKINKLFGTNNSSTEQLENELELISDSIPVEETQERSVPIIIDDTRINHIAKIQSIKEEISTNKDSENYVHESSQRIGELGEADVLKTIQQIKPNYETSLVSSNGHRGDIQSIDHIHKIRWCIEVKCKQNITKEDVDKFERDVITIEDEEEKSTQYNVYGLFVSITSKTVPVYGKFAVIGTNKISLSKDYYTKEVLETIFSFIERYGNNQQQLIINSNTQTINYEFSPETLSLLTQLKIEYQNAMHETEIYNSLESNANQNLTYILQLKRSQLARLQLLKWFNSTIPLEAKNEISQSTINNEREQMIEYIKQTPIKQIRRKDLEERFPSQKVELSKFKTIKDIVKAYK